MSPVRAVIFDMAGTFMDENNLVYKTIVRSFVHYGYEEVDLTDVLVYGAGKEKRQAIIDIARSLDLDLDDKKIDDLHSFFIKELEKAYEVEPLGVFLSVVEVVKELRKKGILVAINTGYKRTVFDQIVRRLYYDFDANVDAIVTADQVNSGRPEPDMIYEICDRLNVTPKACIKVGDSTIDVMEGKNAGVLLTIGITTGAQSREHLARAHPDYIINDMKKLLQIIDAHASHG